MNLPCGSLSYVEERSKNYFLALVSPYLTLYIVKYAKFCVSLHRVKPIKRIKIMYCSRCRHLGTDEYRQLHCWLKDLDPEYVKACKDRDTLGAGEEVGFA